MARYAALVEQNYADTVAEARKLKVAVDALVAAPSASALTAAQEAWRAARVPYGQSEAFRFYDGPIDAPGEGPEGRVNPWPLDEAYLDRVAGHDSDANIIGDTRLTLDRATLIGLHEGGQGDLFAAGAAFDPEASIALGYHAIEFMLWGQDQNPTGPGQRPYTDFVEGGGTLPHGARRASYLQLATDLLVEDLEHVAAAWAPGAAYRQGFEADPTGSMKKLLSAIGILSKGELGSERMDVALTTRDQEDEQSCFSDNTHVDFRMNQRGIQNVYLGRYGDSTGPSVQAILRATDPTLEAKLTAQIQGLVDDLESFTPPVDQAIADRNSAGYQTLAKVVPQLYTQGDLIAEAAVALGLGTISVELPE